MEMHMEKKPEKKKTDLQIIMDLLKRLEHDELEEVRDEVNGLLKQMEEFEDEEEDDDLDEDEDEDEED